jgi:hypothetical protein
MEPPVTETLLGRVSALLGSVLTEAPTPGSTQLLREALDRLDEPLRVAIAGRVKAGKSTLLNALVGEELAPTDAGECTRIVTWYRHGHTYEVLAQLPGGISEQRPFRRSGGAIEVDLGDRALEDVEHLEIRWPSPRLAQHTLVDTPGLASISTDLSARTEQALTGEDHAPAADAVVYLLRHLHANDVRFLEAFLHDQLGQGTPVNAVGVLARADEVGSCRLDAMEVAGRVASRYEADPRMRRLCSTVVPVAGLLAQGAATLREEEFRALGVIAGLPAADAGEALLTADRFAAGHARISVPEGTRVELLRRLGLFGVRLGERLLRTGAVSTATQLAQTLNERSGLEGLRSALLAQFGDRSRVLKARSALAALEAALTTPGWRGEDRIRGELERIMAGAHELEELRIITMLRCGEVEAPTGMADEMVRLLGGSGDDPVVRLGLPEGTAGEDLRAAARGAMGRWQRLAEHPMYDARFRSVARSVVRSCEGITAGVLEDPLARA